jgi:hypothetical protein
LIDNRQERLDFLLGVHDLDYHGEIGRPEADEIPHW